jgi:hypothetical protein
VVFDELAEIKDELKGMKNNYYGNLADIINLF